MTVEFFSFTTMKRSYKFISTSTSFFSVKEFYWSYNVETLPENWFCLDKIEMKQVKIIRLVWTLAQEEHKNRTEIFLLAGHYVFTAVKGSRSRLSSQLGVWVEWDQCCHDWGQWSGRGPFHSPVRRAGQGGVDRPGPDAQCLRATVRRQEAETWSVSGQIQEWSGSSCWSDPALPVSLQPSNRSSLSLQFTVMMWNIFINRYFRAGTFGSTSLTGDNSQAKDVIIARYDVQGEVSCF